jgi:hypothetical protein
LPRIPLIRRDFSFFTDPSSCISKAPFCRSFLPGELLPLKSATPRIASRSSARSPVLAILAVSLPFAATVRCKLLSDKHFSLLRSIYRIRLAYGARSGIFRSLRCVSNDTLDAFLKANFIMGLFIVVGCFVEVDVEKEERHLARAACNYNLRMFMFFN